MERNWSVSVAGMFFGVHDSGPGSSSDDAVLDRLLPDMKSDLRAWAARPEVRAVGGASGISRAGPRREGAEFDQSPPGASGWRYWPRLPRAFSRKRE